VILLAERTRAIIHTKMFLERLLDPRLTPDMPAHVRVSAKALLRHYPGALEVQVAHHALPEWFEPARTEEADTVPVTPQILQGPL
jgi:hypothetical protein